jgi:hypothetical protein
MRQEIGLGQASEILRVEIFWPKTGRTQIVRNLQRDRAYLIREDEKDAHDLALKSFPWPSPSDPPAHPHHHAAMR